MKLTFNQLLADYLYNCINFKDRLSRDHLSESHKIFIKGQIRQNFFDFERMKYYIKKGKVFKRRKATKAQVEEYKIEGDYPVIGMFKYRGVSLPIYLDDYGQQEFIIYKNKEIPGGSFNFSPEDDWMYQIDECLEKDFFESDLYEPVEWEKLKRLCEKELEESVNKKEKK